MGYGDEIMATAHAARLHRQAGCRVEILDRHGKRRWHELWEGNPRIARRGEAGRVVSLVNGPGCRPYIDPANSTPQRWAFLPQVCEPGELYGIAPDERGTGAVVIDPTIKGNASPNKRWPHWQALVAGNPQVEWVQVGPRGSAWLDGVRPAETGSFREACAVLAAANAAVLHEGGLHHAAAALGVAAVVLYGGFTSPAQTGYALHRNLYAGGEPCGMRLPCAHCADAMQAMTPEWVMHELEDLRDGLRRSG